MTVDEMSNLFETLDMSEFLRCEKDPTLFNKRKDLCAFILLDSLDPGFNDVVSAAEHDEIYLSFSPEKIAENITEEQIKYLLRCGVMYSKFYDSFTLYV